MLPSQSCTTKPLSILIGYSGFPCNNREHRSLMCNWNMEYGVKKNPNSPGKFALPRMFWGSGSS